MRWLTFALALPAIVLAHDPISTKLTWAQEISRIVYKRCVGCHRPEGKSPMSLLTYEEARPWAKAIKEQVLNRQMPPWGAVKGFGDFSNDASLTQDEINRLAEWVEGGAPEGETIYLPAGSQTRPRACAAARSTLANAHRASDAPGDPSHGIHRIHPGRSSLSGWIYHSASMAKRLQGCVESDVRVP